MRFLRMPEVVKTSGLSRSTILRKERDGTFPKRVKLGANSIGWRSDEVDDWLESLPRVRGA